MDLGGALTTESLRKKQQTVEAALKRSFVSLPDSARLVFRRDAPEVKDALGTLLLPGELL
jgi:hypothetical protein